ncbi:MAG: hypothetical protein MHMPM18_000106 [Marteilia pararefringens]
MPDLSQDLEINEYKNLEMILTHKNIEVNQECSDEIWVTFEVDSDVNIKDFDDQKITVLLNKDNIEQINMREDNGLKFMKQESHTKSQINNILLRDEQSKINAESAINCRDSFLLTKNSELFSTDRIKCLENSCMGKELARNAIAPPNTELKQFKRRNQVIYY